MTIASILGSVLLGVGLILIGHLTTNHTACTAAHYGGSTSLTVGDLRRRLATESLSKSPPLHTDSWLSAWSHDTPKEQLTPAQAHDVMQLHRGCAMDSCDRKRAAYWTLVAARRIRPDTRADRSHSHDLDQ